MTNPVLLRNVEHKDLKVIPGRGPQFGDDVMSCITFPTEFRDAQGHYPIVFRKTGDDLSFEPIVLFGFQRGENLFLGARGWDAHYVPMAIERQPFLIGRNGDELMVHIDLDHPKVSQTDGEALFLPYGGNTEFLEHMNSTLLAIHQGVQSNPQFIAALQEHELIESFVMDVELDDGSQNRLMGFYTINEDKLKALGGDALDKLNRSGFLMAIYLVVASLSNFRALIERKNRANAAHG